MSEIITLSSEEEEAPEEPPPKKRIKLITLEEKTSKNHRHKSKTTKESTCIVLSDEEEEEEEEKRSNDKVKKAIQADKKDEMEIQELLDNLESAANGLDFKIPSAAASTSANDDDVENQFFVFLDECLQSVDNSVLKELLREKLPIVKKIFRKLTPLVNNFKDFSEILTNKLEKVKTTPEHTIVYFNEVYLWLKSTYKSVCSDKPTDKTNHEKILKKLDKVLLKIRGRIRKLEDSEVRFEDEENSAFIQTARYMERATKIYEKFCKYQNENPNHGRIIYRRLDFSASKFNEVNKVINKKYKNNSVFPTFYDIDKLIRKCVVENEIKISKTDLNVEIKMCFEALGKLLQRRRKLELYENHLGYIEGKSDPAVDQPIIDTTIRTNRKLADQSLDEICAKYTNMQEKNLEPNVSSESDDSDISPSDTDNEQNENNSKNT